jgi:hypothetical protein
MKAISTLLLLAAILISAGAEARTRHHPPYAGEHESQYALNVASSYRANFVGLVSDLQFLGYNVGRPGCLSSGHMWHSKHHWGGACDLFDQVARNVTRLRQPPPAVQIEVASRHGLVSGCSWRHPDCGHFEVPTGNAMWYKRRHHRSARLWRA